MKDKEKKLQEEEKKELSFDDLTHVSGGSMKDKIITTKTTDISEDTKKNI